MTNEATTKDLLDTTACVLLRRIGADQSASDNLALATAAVHLLAEARARTPASPARPWIFGEEEKTTSKEELERYWAQKTSAPIPVTPSEAGLVKRADEDEDEDEDDDPPPRGLTARGAARIKGGRR